MYRRKDNILKTIKERSFETQLLQKLYEFNKTIKFCFNKNGGEIFKLPPYNYFGISVFSILYGLEILFGEEGKVVQFFFFF